MGAAKATSSIEQKIENGNNNIQAMGDIIERLEGDVHKIEEAIFSQASTKNTQEILAYQEYENIEISTKSYPEIQQEYEEINNKNPDHFKYKPIRGDEVRAWYNRQINFFNKIPGASELLKD